MSNNQSRAADSRYQMRQDRKRKEQMKSIFSYGLGALAILALLALLYYVPKQVMTRETFAYQESDIVYGEPIHAVHEMEGSKLASIPFYPKGSPQPKIQATHLYYDLGNIGAEEVVTHQIAIQNVGEAPLTIARAYTTCGCTTAHIDAAELQPGEVTLVTVTLDAGYHDVRGQTVRRGVIIENNDPATPELTFWMQAKVGTTP
jgi:hypothetical protein